MTLAEPVRYQGQLIGVAASNLALDKLIKDVLAIEVPGKGYAILVNQKGKIVAHPTQDLILKPTEEMSAQLTISKLNIAAKDHSLFQLSMDGRDKVLMAEEVANTDWLLVMVMDKGFWSSH